MSVEDAGSRVDRLLGRLLAPDYSRSYLAALIDEGAITVNGLVARPSYRVAEAALVAGDVGQPASSLPAPEPMDLHILYEDEALIVVDKPVGIVIHPGTAAAREPSSTACWRGTPSCRWWAGPTARGSCTASTARPPG